MSFQKIQNSWTTPECKLSPEPVASFSSASAKRFGQVHRVSPHFQHTDDTAPEYCWVFAKLGPFPVASTQILQFDATFSKYSFCGMFLDLQNNLAGSSNLDRTWQIFCGMFAECINRFFALNFCLAEETCTHLVEI